MTALLISAVLVAFGLGLAVGPVVISWQSKIAASREAQDARFVEINESIARLWKQASDTNYAIGHLQGGAQVSDKRIATLESRLEGDRS